MQPDSHRAFSRELRELLGNEHEQKSKCKLAAVRKQIKNSHSLT